MDVLWIVIALLILAVLFGGWSHAPTNRPASWGYWGWSPAVLLLVVLLVLFLTGRI